MADVKKTIEVLFSGKDQMSGVMSSIGGKLKDFDSSVQKIAQPLSDVADSILKVDAALAAMAIGGIAVAINESGKFGDSFNEITTLIKATDSELQTFKGDILAYARESTAGIDDINSAIYTAISAGTSYEDSLKLLNQTEQLSVAGKADLESSTRVLVSSLNAYGVSVDEAQNFSDALFTTVEKGQTTLPELANSLAQVSSIAAQGGVSFDELMAGIAAVTATGAPTSQAMTAIKAAIAAILKPSSEATKEAAKLGIQFDASALATKGLDGVLKDVYKSTGGATDQITKLFGSTESLPAVLTLGADTSGKFADALDAMANKAGATATAYEKMADNFKLTNQNLANNVKATFIQIGSELIDSYTGVVSEVSEVFKSIGEGVDAGAFDDLFDALNTMGADVAGFFDELAKSLPEALEQIDWSGFIEALESIGGSVSGIFDDFDPSDPDKVAKAIQFVVDSVDSLITITKGMVDSFKPFIEGILNSVDAFNKMSIADKEAAGNVLGLAKALTTLGAGFTAVMLAIGNNAESIKTTFEVVAGAVQFGFSALKTGLQVIAVAVLEGIDTILSAAELVTFGEWDEKIKAARAGIATEMVALQERMFDSADQVEKGWDKLVGAFDEPAEAKIAVDKARFDKSLNEANADLIDWSKNVTVAAIAVDIEPQMDPEAMKGVEDFFKDLPSSMDSDAFSGIDDFMGDLEKELEKDRIELGVDVDDKSIEDTKKKIKQSFSKASMGPVELGFDISEGVGPLSEATETNNEALTDATDALGSLSDLLSAANDATGLAKHQRERLAQQAAKASIDLVKAIEKQIRVQTNLAILQQQANDIMTSTAEDGGGTIEIDMKGVEPEFEMVMWKMLKLIQVRANESGAEFLLAAAS